MTNSVLGGVASAAAGGNFANGAVTAAFGYLFNATNNVGATVHAPGPVVWALGKAWEWLTGNELKWIPTGVGGGLVHQYADPTVPSEAGIERDLGVYVQVHWEIFGKPTSLKLSAQADWGTGSGRIDDTFAGDAWMVYGMVSGAGASGTFSTDNNTLIGLGIHGGAGWGGGWNYTKTRAITFGDFRK